MFGPIFGAFNLFLVLAGLTILAIFSALVLFFLFRRNEKIAKTAAVRSVCCLNASDLRLVDDGFKIAH
jgi:hypothetical protein